MYSWGFLVLWLSRWVDFNYLEKVLLIKKYVILVEIAEFNDRSSWSEFATVPS